MEKRNLLLKENKVLCKISNNILYNGKIGKQGMVVPKCEKMDQKRFSQYEYDQQGTDFAVKYEEKILTQVNMRAAHEHQVNTTAGSKWFWLQQNRENFIKAFGENSKALVCYKSKTPIAVNEKDEMAKNVNSNEID